jgi:hypothetical protein
LSVNSILNTGALGIRAGIEQADLGGSRLAGLGNSFDVSDVATALVEMKIGEIQVKASASVLKTADQMLGTIIDISA